MQKSDETLLKETSTCILVMINMFETFNVQINLVRIKLLLSLNAHLSKLNMSVAMVAFEAFSPAKWRF